MYYECEESILKDFLHKPDLSSAPTVKDFIIAAIEKLS